MISNRTQNSTMHFRLDSIFYSHYIYHMPDLPGRRRYRIQFPRKSNQHTRSHMRTFAFVRNNTHRHARINSHVCICTKNACTATTHRSSGDSQTHTSTPKTHTRTHIVRPHERQKNIKCAHTYTQTHRNRNRSSSANSHSEQH